MLDSLTGAFKHRHFYARKTFPAQRAMSASNCLSLWTLLALPLLSEPAQAIEWQSSAISSAVWSADTSKGKRQNLQLSIEPEFILRFDDRIKLTSLTRLRSISLDALSPEKVTGHAYSSWSKPLYMGDTSELELREFYLEIPRDNYYLTLGKQQVVWGKADGLKVLDIVNPQSFREFILEDFDDSRVPQWMANIETSLDEWSAQLLWIPDKSYNVLPSNGALYTITSPQLAPQPPLGISVEQKPVKQPGSVFMDSDLGLRLSRFWKGWDLTLNYLYQYDNFPLPYRNVITTVGGPLVEVEQQYQRTHVLGGSFSNAIDDWVVRGEVAYFSDRYYLAKDFSDSNGITKGSEVSYVFGLDWSGLENTLVSTQLFQSVATNRESNTLRDKTSSTLSLLINRTLLNEAMELRLIWLANTNTRDGLGRLRLSYEWQDDLKTWISSDTFYGNSQGVFGQFDDNDRLSFGIELGFQ